MRALFLTTIRTVATNLATEAPRVRATWNASARFDHVKDLCEEKPEDSKEELAINPEAEITPQKVAQAELDVALQVGTRR